MASQAQVRRQRFPGEPGDALEHLALTNDLQGLTIRLRQAGHGLEAKQREEETRRTKLVEGSGDD